MSSISACALLMYVSNPLAGYRGSDTLKSDVWPYSAYWQFRKCRKCPPKLVLPADFNCFKRLVEAHVLQVYCVVKERVLRLCVVVIHVKFVCVMSYTCGVCLCYVVYTCGVYLELRPQNRPAV